MLSAAGEFPAAAGSGAINRTGREEPGGGGASGRFPALPPSARRVLGPGMPARRAGARAALTPSTPRGSLAASAGEGVMASMLGTEMKTHF